MMEKKGTQILSDEEIRAFRDGFPESESFVNYQWGGYSSKPRAVMAESKRWLDRISVLPADPDLGEDTEALRSSLRKKLSSILGVSTEEIAFTTNTTNGINIVAWGLDLKEGDRILLSKHEHPANILPWYSVADRRGLEVDFLGAHEDAARLMEDLEHHLASHSYRVLALTHVSRYTGFRLPVRQMIRRARGTGAFVLLDGAQTVGCLPVDLNELDCDAYAFCGHKWLFAPQGTGGLFVKKESVSAIEPSWVGVQSVVSYDKEGNRSWRNGMGKHEYGTRDLSGLAGWLKAIEMLDTVGFSRIYRTIELAVDNMKSEILSLGDDLLATDREWKNSSAIVAMHLRGTDARRFSEYLWKNHKILCAPVENDDRLRICHHFVNTEAERDRLLGVVSDLLTGRIGVPG